MDNPDQSGQPKGRPPIKITVKTLEEQIILHNGNIAAVARVFGVHRHTILRRVEKSKDLQQVLEDARETMLDNAESQLYSKVLAGDSLCLMFFLKTQGKKRGYVEKHEVTGAEGIPLHQEMAHVFNKIYGGISEPSAGDQGSDD